MDSKRICINKYYALLILQKVNNAKSKNKTKQKDKNKSERRNNSHNKFKFYNLIILCYNNLMN